MQLPVETQTYILGYCGLHMLQMRLVCSLWRDIVDQHYHGGLEYYNTYGVLEIAQYLSRLPPIAQKVCYLITRKGDVQHTNCTLHTNFSEGVIRKLRRQRMQPDYIEVLLQQVQVLGRNHVKIHNTEFLLGKHNIKITIGGVNMIIANNAEYTTVVQRMRSILVADANFAEFRTFDDRVFRLWRALRSMYSKKFNY